VANSVRERLAQARALARRGELAAAEATYTALLAEQPGFADVHNELGLLLHELGDFDRAEAEFRQAVAINPAYTEAALHLSIVENDLGHYDAARTAFDGVAHRTAETSHGLDPLAAGKIANLLADVADGYLAAGQPARAIRSLREALELGPAFHDLRLRLARALTESGEHAAAIHELLAVTTRAPDLTAAHVQLGVAQFAAGDRAAALASWRAVLAREPANDRAAMYLRLAGEQR
jgi:tetratricopeptide (TPR) repeat protein